jgi:outer membrane protein TolC
LGGGKNDSTGNFSDTQDYQVGLGWRIGPGGLFDFGRMNATKARFETVRLTGEKLISEITRQVVEAVTQVQSLADQMDLAQKNLATASEALRLSRERKEFGVGVVLEDIQAQQELTRARSDYVAAIAEFNKAQYRLTKAVGTVSEISRPAAR